MTDVAGTVPLEPTAGQPGVRPRWRRRTGVATAVALTVFGVPHASSGLDHTVIPGESLGLIAPQYGTSIDAIVAANALTDPNVIYSGQVLTIPNAPTSTTTHIIAEGETLGVIAAGFGLTIAELAAANGIDDPNLVREGTLLSIPGPTPKAQASPQATSHTVAIGETLAAIAARYGTTVAAIMDANGLGNPDFIVEGAVIAIGEAPSTAKPPPAASSPSGTIHVVASGETLGVIAATYDTTAAAIADANGLADVHVVVVGMELAIPAPPEEVTTSPTTVVGTTTAPLIEQWAKVYGVPVDLLKALTWFESGWNNTMVSSVGAIGIGQLMPSTIEFVSTQLLNEAVDPYDLSDNIRASARLMRYLLDETGWDATAALAGYYQGLTSLRQEGIYASSRLYIEGILSLRSRF